MDPRDEPTAHLSLAVNAKASKHVNVSQTYTRQHEWTGEGEAQARTDSEKSSSAFVINHGDCKTTWTFAHDKFSMKAAAKAFDQEGWKGNVNAAIEHKPAKGEWKIAPTLAVQSPDFSGVSMWFNVSTHSLLDRGYDIHPHNEKTRFGTDASHKIPLAAS